MEIATIKMLSFRFLILIGVISLVACGGSGGGKSSGSASLAKDTTPNAFIFTASTKAQTSTSVTSPTITISGIDAAAPVSITGGEYSISGGAFTSTAGTISNGQTLAVRITTSDKTNTPKEAIVTVGGVSAKFSATTAADVTPDAFSFAPKNEVAVDTEQTSEAITVKGIDVAVPVSITGGSYSINSGDFTSAAGTVSAGQTITVKTTSGSKTEASTATVLTIGGVTGTFTVTTVSDTFAPVAEFKFPTPYTMSEANEVKVRGTASDDNAIKSVKLVVGSTEIEATPKSETNGVKDFSTWIATIPLTVNAENEIKVIATDDRDNMNPAASANKVVVRHRVDYSGAFPDSGSPVDSTAGLLLDTSRKQLLYSAVSGDKIYKIDINSGEANIFADFDDSAMKSFGMGVIGQDNKNAYFPLLGSGSNTIIRLNLDSSEDYSVHKNEAYRGNHRAITINNVNDTPMLISARQRDTGNSGGIVSTRLDNWEAVVLSDSILGIPDNTNPFGDTSAITFDKKNNRYLVAGSSYDAVIAIDASTGARSVFSSELIGSGDAYGAADAGLIRAIVLDEPRSRLVVLEMTTGNIFAVDLDTAKRLIISKMTLLHPFSDVWPLNEKNYSGAQIDVENELLYTVHHRVKALMVVDLQTGQQLILSKAEN